MNQLLKHITTRGNENSKVVALAKNSDRLNPSQRDARLVRQTPRSKRFEIQIRLQVYQRARYYDCNSGEFISQDPLGYVDGMSLYRGCFCFVGIDPSGLLVFLDDDIEEISWKRFVLKYWLTEAQQSLLDNGCQGVAQLFIGQACMITANRQCFFSGWNSKNALADAKKTAARWKAMKKCKCGVGIFSYAFWKGKQKWPKSCPICSYVGVGIAPD